MQRALRKRQRTALVRALRSKSKSDLSTLVPAVERFVRSVAVVGGHDKNTAERLVDDWLATQAALHDPDQVAGGNPEGVTGLGNREINSEIGRQWGTGAGRSTHCRYPR